MTGPWFGNTFVATAARWLGAVTIAAVMSSMPAVPSMSAVTEHVHRDHPGGEQYPNPVLREPFHDLLRCQH